MELTAQDICKIIRSCKDNAVKVFEYGNLKVRFSSHPLVDAPKPMGHTFSGKPSSDEVDKARSTEEEEFLLSETVLTKEAELSDLLITEPEKYEALALSGDLVDGREKPSDHIGS